MNVKRLVDIKIISTILVLTLIVAFELTLSCCSYTIPYILAVMFDDTITKTVGLTIISAFAIYILAWLASPILLRIRHPKVFRAGVIITIVLNICDIVCCFLSFLELQDISKAINFVFSVLVIIISWRTLCRKAV